MLQHMEVAVEDGKSTDRTWPREFMGNLEHRHRRRGGRQLSDDVVPPSERVFGDPHGDDRPVAGIAHQLQNDIRAVEADAGREEGVPPLVVPGLEMRGRP